MTIETLIFVGGILHFGVLCGATLVPFELDFRGNLSRVPKMLRQLVWVYAVYIASIIACFGAASVFLTSTLTDGSFPARLICGFIAAFWGARLVVQLFAFDARPHLRNLFLRAGYHGLTVVFVYNTAVYGAAAFVTG